MLAVDEGPDAKVQIDEKWNPKQERKFVRGPTAPSAKSPPAKKADPGPSDEKKARAVDDKENVNAAFALAAPHAVHCNSEIAAKQTLKTHLCREDQQTAEEAFIATKNCALQTGVAPDSKNKVSCRVPTPLLIKPQSKPPPEEEVVVEHPDNDKHKKSDWALKNAACKSADAFKNCAAVEKAAVVAEDLAKAHKTTLRRFR